MCQAYKFSSKMARFVSFQSALKNFLPNLAGGNKLSVNRIRNNNSIIAGKLCDNNYLKYILREFLYELY